MIRDYFFPVNLKNFAIVIGIFAIIFTSHSIASAGSVKGGKSGSFSPPGAQQQTDQEEKPTPLMREFERKTYILDSMGQSDSPVYVYARRQEYRTSEHLIIYEGNVVIKQDTLSLKANRVVVNTHTRKAVIEGDVEFSLDRDFITADRGEIDLRTREMRLENCRGIIEPSLFFEAEVLERLMPRDEEGRGRYYFYKVTFSACNQLVPNWALRAREMYATAEKYMHLFGSTFLIKGIPVLWLPYWFYPIKTERSTGFLVPSFGYSSRDGFNFKVEFFWAMADNADLTLTQVKRGEYRNESKAQFRYALAEDSQGDFVVRYVHEMKDPFTKEQIPQGERDIYLFQAAQTQHFPGDIDWKLNVDYQNNPRIKSLYYENLAQQSQSYTNSWAGFSRNWSSLLASLDGSYTESSNLFINRKHSLTHLPNFSLSVPNTRIGKTGVTWSLFSMVSNMSLFDAYTFDDSPDTEADESEANRRYYFALQRLHFAPRIRWNIPRKRTWFQISPQLELFYTQWDRRKEIYDGSDTWNTYAQTLNIFYFRDEEVARIKKVKEGFWARTYRTQDGLVREAYRASVNFTGPIFYRIFDTEKVFKSVQRLKHRFWPGIIYTYTPDTNQGEVINIDPFIDYLAPSDGITYYLKSDLIGKVYDKFDDKYKIRSLGSFIIKQSFDFRLNRIYRNRMRRYHDDLTNDPDAAVYPPRQYYPHGFVTTRLELYPSERLWFTAQTNYDPYWGALQRSNVDLYLQATSWYFRGGWGKDRGRVTLFNSKDPDYDEYTQDDIEYYYLAYGGHITQRWGTAINVMYDYHREKFHHGNVAIVYDRQCWGVTLAFNSRQYNDQALYIDPKDAGKVPIYRDEYNITLMIHLKHLGTIGGYDYTSGFGLAQ